METNTTAKKAASTGLWKKLMEIQRSAGNFQNTAESEKQDSRGKHVYKYTPGAEIVERLRALMDQKGIMLIPNAVGYHSEVIEYPVYKMIGQEPHSFTKREVLFILETDFTWVDTESGETFGPTRMVSSGANGTDKSCASAISTAERYFLLKFFHLTTSDEADELDAHDSETVPGLKGAEQPLNASPAQAALAQPVRQGATAPVPAYVPAAAPQRPATAPQNYGFQPVVAAPAAPAPVMQAAPAVQQGVPRGGFDINNRAIFEAVNSLAYFEIGTPSHQQRLNKIIGELAAKGIPCTSQDFIDTLVSTAKNLREGGHSQQ